MIIAALILSNLFGCTKAIADDLDVGKVYSRIEIVQKVDATVSSEKNNVIVEMRRGYCGEKKCLVGRSDAGSLEFRYDSLSMFPSARLSNSEKDNIRIGAEYCDIDGNCDNVSIKRNWKNINLELIDGKKKLYSNYLIIAPIGTKNSSLEVEYTVMTRESENETW